MGWFIGRLPIRRVNGIQTAENEVDQPNEEERGVFLHGRND
jgi:hypothetical protein